jgi:hypothetical protein
MFIAAGRPYLATALLKAKADGVLDGILYKGYQIPAYRDIYGQKVLYFRERFPCFDAYDRLHENRYYHWYAICHEGGVTLVYTQDEKPGAQVHEAYLPGARTAFYTPSWIAKELGNAGLFAGRA